METNNSSQKYRIGIDLGGTNIKVGIVNSQNEILATHSCKTLVERPWQEIAEDMINAIDKVALDANVSKQNIVSCGIGSPGIVNALTGSVVYSNNFPTWVNIPLASTLSEKLNMPVNISNDANCAALGEFVAGGAKGYNSVVLLTLGTGVGGGVVFNGKIFEGGGAGGAELGHSIIAEDGEQCTCGRKGCLEAYASATALVRQTKKAAAENPTSLLNEICEHDFSKINGRTAFLAKEKNDEVAIKVIDEYIKHLGEGIVNMVNIFRPQVVLLSGGICGEKEKLTNPLNVFVKAHAFGNKHVAVPEVKTATLGNNAGIVGAANL